MNADEAQQGRPRALGDLIEYAPDRWIKASAVIAIEPLEGGSNSSQSKFQSAVTLLAGDGPARAVRRQSIYPVGVLAAAVVSVTSAIPHSPPPPSAESPQARPGRKASSS
jgi:hypothetical protein